MDSSSCNYNSDAEEDDGTCLTNDCSGECGGLAVVDSCLVCDIDISNDCTQDCAGNWGGTAIIDSCNVCGGTILVADDCPQCADGLELGCDLVCAVNPKVLDECGVCGGNGIPASACDCDGNVDAGCGCGEAGPSGCDNACGSTAEVDECGICGGDGIADGACDCDGNVLDCSDVCGGTDTSCQETDTTLPSATILSPASGATVSEITTIEVYATDNVGIQKIEFYIADELKFTDTESPYEYEWNTSSYSDGVDYTLIVRAYDIAGNMTIVAPILLTVDNTGKYPTTPTIYGRYEDSKFLLSWTQNDDSDFASYTLYESSNADMTDSTAIYTSDSNQNISYEVTGIGADTRRYYRLIITDSIGLKSASSLQGVSNYQKIVFWSASDIYIADIDGEIVTNITTDIDENPGSPKFTPDGKRIIFPYREQSGANTDYYIMNLDGTDKTNITNGSLPNDIDGSGYRISPDGTKILFYDWGSCYDIWTINIDGTSLTNLTNNRTTCDRYPDFSSDGQKIVFTRDGVIYIMDSNGGSVTNLSTSGEYPLYSPSGDKIAYLNGSNPRLWIMDINGSTTSQLTSSDFVACNQIADVIFTPNGQGLLFRTGTCPNYGIGFINIDGTGETNLTPNSQCHEPKVSSDGSKIVFQEQGASNYIKIMDIDGSNVQTIYGGDAQTSLGNLGRTDIQPIP